MSTDTAPRQDSGTRLMKPRTNMQGCFICRIRKKRCPVSTETYDMQREKSCKNCTDLSIKCLGGYGELIPIVYRTHLDAVKDILKRWNRSSDAKRPGQLLDLAEELNRRGLGRPTEEGVAPIDATFGLAPVPYNGLSPTPQLDIRDLLQPSPSYAYMNLVRDIDRDQFALTARGPGQGDNSSEDFPRFDSHAIGPDRPEPFFRARNHSAPISFQRAHDAPLPSHSTMLDVDALHASYSPPHAHRGYVGSPGFDNALWTPSSLPAEIAQSSVADSGVSASVPIPPNIHSLQLHRGGVQPHPPEFSGHVSTFLGHQVHMGDGFVRVPTASQHREGRTVFGARGFDHGHEWWPEQDPGALGWDPAFEWNHSGI